MSCRKRDHSSQSGGRVNHDKEAAYHCLGVESRKIPEVTKIGYDCKTERLKALSVAYNSRGLGLDEEKKQCVVRTATGSNPVTLSKNLKTIIMKHSIQVKVKNEVVKKLNFILIDSQEIKNKITAGSPSEKAITEDFTYEHLEANGVYSMVSFLEDDIKTLKMLLNLLK